MSPAYVLICLLNFALITWVLVKFTRENPRPPRNDDDDGGVPFGHALPDFDLPSGSGLDDLLVDRPPKDWVDAPSRPVPALREE